MRQQNGKQATMWCTFCSVHTHTLMSHVHDGEIQAILDGSPTLHSVTSNSSFYHLSRLHDIKNKTIKKFMRKTNSFFD